MAPRKSKKSRQRAEPRTPKEPLRDSETHARRGYSSLGLERLDDAVGEFEEALRLNPHNVEALSGLGVAYRKLGCPDDALQKYEAAIQIKPDYARAHCNLGVIHWHQARWDEASREFEAALRIRPGDAEPHFGLGSTYAEQGRLAEAAQQFQVALQIRPDFADARHNLAAVCLQQQLWREAVGQFQTILQEIAPDDSGAHLGLGLAYRGLGLLDDAIQQFQVVLLLDPKMGEAHHALAEAYLEQGDLDIALNEAERASELGYEPAEFLVEQLRDLLPPEPVEQPPEPKPKRPRRARKPREKPRHKAKEKAEKEAEEEAKPAEAPDRFNEAQAHFRKAMTYRKQGQWDRVVDELQAALRINPGFYSAHIELGKVYARTREWDKAIADYTDVVRVRPGFATVHFLMGLVYLEQGNWEEAARKFQTTLNLDRNLKQAERGLDLARSHLDRSDVPEESSSSDA